MENQTVARCHRWPTRPTLPNESGPEPTLPIESMIHHALDFGCTGLSELPDCGNHERFISKVERDCLNLTPWRMLKLLRSENGVSGFNEEVLTGTFECQRVAGRLFQESTRARFWRREWQFHRRHFARTWVRHCARDNEPLNTAFLPLILLFPCGRALAVRTLTCCGALT